MSNLYRPASHLGSTNFVPPFVSFHFGTFIYHKPTHMHNPWPCGSVGMEKKKTYFFFSVLEVYNQSSYIFASGSLHLAWLRLGCDCVRASAPYVHSRMKKEGAKNNNNGNLFLRRHRRQFTITNTSLGSLHIQSARLRKL